MRPKSSLLIYLGQKIGDFCAPKSDFKNWKKLMRPKHKEIIFWKSSEKFHSFLCFFNFHVLPFYSFSTLGTSNFEKPDKSKVTWTVRKQETQRRKKISVRRFSGPEFCSFPRDLPFYTFLFFWLSMRRSFYRDFDFPALRATSLFSGFSNFHVLKDEKM